MRCRGISKKSKRQAGLVYTFLFKGSCLQKGAAILRGISYYAYLVGRQVCFIRRMRVMRMCWALHADSEERDPKKTKYFGLKRV